ncbi:MAG TPA: hypothetical protein ENL03_02610, partial [Phycisphaerae bacterium]|nr:hypothetical protein [Phycisphaerae bacterium]
MKNAMILSLVVFLSAGFVCAEEAKAPTATHKESQVIGKEKAEKFKKLSTLCLGSEGNLLAADAGENHIRVYSPTSERKATWKLKFSPTAICLAPDGGLYVGGTGIIAKLD